MWWTRTKVRDCGPRRPRRAAVDRPPTRGRAPLRGADGYVTRRDIEDSMAHEDGLADVSFKARHILACFDMDQVSLSDPHAVPSPLDDGAF